MHYAYITSVKRLCYSQHSKTKSGGYFCDKCLQFFTVNNTTHNKLECGKVASFYPEPNTTTSFQDFHKKLSPPVVIYADIEKMQKHTACACV